jgi:hypothetical protein
MKIDLISEFSLKRKGVFQPEGIFFHAEQEHRFAVPDHQSIPAIEVMKGIRRLDHFLPRFIQEPREIDLLFFFAGSKDHRLQSAKGKNGIALVKEIRP